MQKDYQSYTVSDFLQDDNFLKYRLSPNKEDKLFWENFIHEYPEKEEIVNRAIAILGSVKLNNYSFSPRDKESILKDIFESIKKKKKRKTHRFILSTAASILLILSCSYFVVYRITGKRDTHVERVDDGVYNAKNIQLILADNKRIAFEGDVTIQYDNGHLIVSSGDCNLVSELDDKNGKINKLIVPNGKRSLLTLSDGSKIWINSGTTIEYPTVFEAKKREIHVDGEIYIEVAKNEEQPFFVNTSSFSVRVIGTCFNISSYREEAEHSLVLVQGSVEAKTGSEEKITLQPDQLLMMGLGRYQIKKVNVYDYISWKDGLLQFRSEPLDRMLCKLSRYYDVEIECDPDIRNKKCTGKLVLSDHFDAVLQTISSIIPIHYTKNGNKVIISKKS